MVINKVIIGGNIVSMEDLITMENEKATQKFKFVIATNETWKVKDSDERKSKTQFTNVVVYGDKAKELSQILYKGMPLMVEGKLNNYSYDNKDKEKKWWSEVVMFKYKTLDQIMSGSNATNIDNQLPIEQTES